MGSLPKFCFILWLFGLSSAVEEEVHGLRRNEEFIIESPEFPEPIPPNTAKNWMIHCAQGSRIKMKCIDVRLDQRNPGRCDTDKLEIFDGAQNHVLCGNKYDFVTVTSGNLLKVSLRTGNDISGGVNCVATVYVEPTVIPEPPLIEESLQLTAGGPGKMISSLDYPKHVDAYVKQDWHISTTPGSRIRITCYDIRLFKGGDKCSDSEYLKIVDGENERVLCGAVYDFSMLSSGESLTVYFRKGQYQGGGAQCKVEGKIMDWYGEATPPPTTTTPKPPPYLGIPSEEIDSTEHGGPPGAKDTTCKCGWANKVSSRIVNGKETKINEYPFAVAVYERRSKWTFCGGSILTPYHVITAEHCTWKYVKNNVSLSVVVGDHNLYIDDTDAVQDIEVKQIIQHAEFSPSTLLNDIALLLLETKIEFNQYVGPVCLPPVNGWMELARQYIKILGWGTVKWQGSASDTLQEVNLRVIHLESCQKLYSNIPLNPRTHICTYGDKKASCQGDSGGPVVWLDPETNRYTLVGLVSFGRICASEDPGVHTAVASYVNWIHETIEATLPQKTCSKVL